MTVLDLETAPAATKLRMPKTTLRAISGAGLAALRRLGASLAEQLRTGDVVLLRGDLGVGKSELARATIQARMGAPVDVPSPTFTLVQTYETPGLLLTHVDLYRVEHLNELSELGLDEAMEQGAVLVEWPDRAPGLWPETRLEIELAVSGDGEARRVQLAGHGEWADRIARLRWDPQ